MESGSEPRRPDGGSPPAGFDPRPDPKLVDQGWIRRNLADPRAAREAMELYASLGYEVRAEPLRPADFGAGCEGCARGACDEYVLVYTRKPSPDDSGTT